MRTFPDGRRIEIDLRKEALHDLGINMSDDQLHDLAMINLMKSTGEIDKDDHVTTILFVLRLLGLMPEKTDSSFPINKIKYLDCYSQKGSSESLSEADVRSAVERSLHLQEGQELPVLKL